MDKIWVQDDKLQLQIDWEKIMPMSRNAGGHDEQMTGLFKGAAVIGHWNEGDYQGTVATCVKLPDGRFAIYNDSYGSCSGCDSWEDATDDEVKSMCITLANDAYVFETIDGVREFLRDTERDGVHYSWDKQTKRELLAEISKN
jgi:hypothetical protein